MSRPRVLVLDDHAGVALDSADWSGLLARAEVVVVREHLDEETLLRRASSYDVVVAMRERTAFPRRVLEQLPRLRLLVTTGMVNAAIDLAAAHDQGITVCGTRGRGPDAAELAWALVMDLVRGVSSSDRSMRAGRWQDAAPGRRLAGTTVGLLGLGTVGRQVALYARAFGCEVLAWSRHLTDERAAACGAVRAELDELLERSHVVSVHLPLTDETRGLLGARELALLGPTGYLVNTSRGPIVVEDDLTAALRDATLAGAGLDVYDVEPLPVDHPLRREPRVVLTSHLGYVTRETFAVFYAEAVEDVLGWLDGSPLRVLG